jgi:thioredoxin reductase (NADPH)
MADEEVMDIAMADDMEMEEAPVRNSPYEYDYFVIGGGSGGLASAKEAASLGAKVALADFVSPSPKGTAWGLGGTCVNVGCIPKKLMHYSASFGEQYKDQQACGWELPGEKRHNWERMVTNVQKHIQTLNWGYRIQLMDKNVQYFNNYASFVDPHTVALSDKTGKVVKKVTSEHFLIAVGGRPTYGIPGAESCCFTSDDIFSMKVIPDDLLVVGASYISLECAGFLHGLGKKVKIMVRSILLRGFDQEIAEKLGAFMSHSGIEFIREAVPSKFEKLEDGRVQVFYTQSGEEKVEIYGGVLLAIGRYALTKGLNLQNAGVETSASNLKVLVNHLDQSNIPHIWAVGDVADGKPELTPVAIQAGTLLARRLFRKSVVLMDYLNIATTVFTPLEYGSVGYSEERAREVLGDENVEVFHSVFRPLEWNFLPEREEMTCFAKVLVNLQNGKVIGIHFLGPHAGEVIQGFAVAVKAGLTKDVLDMTVGIHPTSAEEVTKLFVTKRSGASAVKTGC